MAKRRIESKQYPKSYSVMHNSDKEAGKEKTDFYFEYHKIAERTIDAVDFASFFST